jgi:two-component system NtrC family sensor kinase
MKKIILTVIFFGVIELVLGQNGVIDSLRNQLSAANTDSARAKWLGSLADYYAFVQFDSSIFYARQTIDLSNKSNSEFGNYNGLRCMFLASNCQGNYPKALEYALSMSKIAEHVKHPAENQAINPPYYFLGLLSREMGNFSNAIDQLHKAIQWQQSSGKPMPDIFYAFSQLAIVYENLKQMDSALIYAQRGYDLGAKSINYKRYFSLAIAALGSIHQKIGHNELAKNYFLSGIQQSKSFNNLYFEARNYNLLASLFKSTGHPDSCLYYAGISLQLCQEHNFSEFKQDAAHLLTQVYELQNKPDSTLKYIKIWQEAKDSVFSQSKVQQFQKVAFDEELNLEKMNEAKERYIDQIKLYSLISALLVLLIIGFILYRNNKQKQKANILLQEQKQQIQNTLTELKSTQSQLIQSEKMASLGELTAGIAHEIQNPLNFVNNFSEVNKEMLAEMKGEMDKGNLNEAKSIANDVIDNEQKISHHGRRADAIVKGMLQHSRNSTGQKEPTDINKLTDEYLRLAYQGFHAKDNSFNARLTTEFDQSIGNVNVIRQDIGRVILNLINNAFYTVNDKQKQNLNGYQPSVTVSTDNHNGKIEVRVKDNGNGIPQKILDKIFQPFFTTKPTGQGTGLGLSLSYDIIKVHGGEIKVDTKEGEGSVFIIQLPVV